MTLLKLNKEIYPQKAILRAVKAYKKIANFKLSQKGKYFLVKGTITSADENLVKDEFLNFVLGNINQ